MSNPTDITILCEDRQQASFVRRFLMKRGSWTHRDLVFNVAPEAGGSAEQWVREQFPAELRAYRSSHKRYALIVVIDADRREVLDRIKDFDNVCEKHDIAKKRLDERVLFVVPKRNIETWLLYLSGQDVDEDKEYRGYDSERRCRPNADRLAEMCMRQQPLEGHPPASLERCCHDFQAFWCLIQP